MGKKREGEEIRKKGLRGRREEGKEERRRGAKDR